MENIAALLVNTVTCLSALRPLSAKTLKTRAPCEEQSLTQSITTLGYQAPNTKWWSSQHKAEALSGRIHSWRAWQQVQSETLLTRNRCGWDGERWLWIYAASSLSRCVILKDRAAQLQCEAGGELTARHIRSKVSCWRNTPGWWDGRISVTAHGPHLGVITATWSHRERHGYRPASIHMLLATLLITERRRHRGQGGQHPWVVLFKDEERIAGRNLVPPCLPDMEDTCIRS